MRKLGSSQLAMLRCAKMFGSVTKSAFMGGHDWRVIDRLEELGLFECRFVRGEGPTYFLTEAGEHRQADGVQCR